MDNVLTIIGFFDNNQIRKSTIAIKARYYLFRLSWRPLMAKNPCFFIVLAMGDNAPLQLRLKPNISLIKKCSKTFKITQDFFKLKLNIRKEAQGLYLSKFWINIDNLNTVKKYREEHCSIISQRIDLNENKLTLLEKQIQEIKTTIDEDKTLLNKNR